MDTRTAGRPARLYYVPAETELGADFAATLEVPEVCGVVEGATTATGANSESGQRSNVDRAARIIGASSAAELGQIIKLATRRLGLLGDQPQ
ncbi:MAG TPA: hypothetical protein VLF71_04600 [Candidatus Saccharimonadales bacterium]|nr:hypothetical protein [Candidatus Saccharimonadales bacterium]